MTKDKSRGGIKFSITVTLILTLTVVSLTQLYLSIEAITGVDQHFTTWRENAANTHAHALATRLARDRVENIDRTIRRLKGCSSLLAREAEFYLERIELYGEIARNPDEELIALGNGIFTGPSHQIAGVSFWGDSISPQVRRQINSLSYLDPSLMSVAKENTEILACYIHTQSNIHRYCPNVSDREPQALNDYDLRREAIYVMANPENNPQRKTVWTNPYRGPAGKLLITASTPIYCNGGNFIGVAAVDVVMESVLQTRSLKNFNMLFFVIDRRGNIISCLPKTRKSLGLSEQEYNLFNSNFPDMRKAVTTILDKNFSIANLRLNGLRYQVCSNILSANGWKMLVIAPRDSLFPPVIEKDVGFLIHTILSMMAKFFLTAFSCLLLSLIIIRLFLHKRLLSPLIKLTKAAKKINDGDLMTQVDIFRQDEIGAFARAFNTMVEGLQKTKESQKGYTRRLERKVGNSTREIRVKNYELEDSLSTLKNEIAERIAAEKQLKISKEKAEAATRAKSLFLANMSHEIRTPMNAILGFAELLENKISNDREKQYLASIRSSGETLLGIINDILDLSKIEAGKLEIQYDTVNVRTVFKEIAQIFSRQAKDKELDFRVEVFDFLPDWLMLDEIRMRQILLNLVGNAMKFTRSGYVKLSVRCLMNEKNTVDLTFSVKDTGIGIPYDQEELIFEAFRQQEGQKASYGGTGLGLAITKRLVEMMGGKITVDSKVNRGSNFHVLLKNVEIASSKQRIESEEDIGAIEFEKASILLVDDIMYNRELLKGFLDFSTFELIEAKNGREAVDLAKLYKPDLILMDMKMPIIDGYEAVRIIRKDKKIASIPVIAITASVMKEDEDLVKSVGCNGFLRKPVSGKELLAEIRRFLSHSIQENEEMSTPRRDDVSANKTLSADTREKIPDLLHILQSETQERWNDVRQMFIINDIEKFAREIERLAEEYQLDLLGNWGRALARQTKNFDMERLPKTLDAFPDMLKAIEELIQ